MDMYQQGHQSTGRKRCFRLVQQINSISAEAVGYQCQKTLTVGLVMQRPISVGGLKSVSNGVPPSVGEDRNLLPPAN